MPTLLEDKSPAEIHLAAHRAREVLTARSREITRAHSDRIRQLTELMRQISAADFTEGETIGTMPGVSLSPELAKLIINPTDGL